MEVQSPGRQFATREAVEDFIRGDPFALNGVVSDWRVREWNLVIA